jgi:hypothetical protein
LLVRALLPVVLCSFHTYAATWYVAPSGSDAAQGTNWATAKQTIQAAIDASSASDTVLVSNGVYQTGGRVATSDAVTNRVVIDKPITVQSVNGPASTTIQGAGPPGDAAVRCAWMTNGATLIGFTLTNGATYVEGGGLWAQSAAAVASNCIFTGNSSSLDGGGACRGTLNNCTLVGNLAGNAGGGANASVLNNCTLSGNTSDYVGGGAHGATLNNCTLRGNSAFEGGGANASTLNNCVLTGNASTDYGGGAYGGTLNNCTLAGNASGIEGGGAYLSTLNNCIVYFNTASAQANYSGGTIAYTCTTPLPAGTGNIGDNPLFVNLAATNLALATNSPCRDIGNNAHAPGTNDLAGNPRIVNGSVDMGAYEIQTPPAPGSATHYVRLGSPNPQSPYAGWATAATNIQHAIDVAATGDTVLVSNGVYQTGGRVVPGTLLTNRVVIDRPVTVRSVNGPAGTIIKGAGTMGNAAVRCAWMTNGATLIGFTLTNGATRSSLSDLEGGGLWAQSAAAVASNCIFTGNSASLYGGGAYGGTFNNCTFTFNQAFDSGGGAYGSTLNNSSVTSNSAESGGGAYGSTLVNCTLTRNAALTGAGAYGGTLSNCTLTGNVSTDNGGGAFNALLNACTLTGNSAVYGGGAALGTLNNCLLTGNTAVDSGGGAFVATLNNSTVSGNSASTNGGGVYLGALTNCIVYFNTAPTSNNYYNSTVAYTCTTPLPAGTGNITNDPLFVSLATTNLTLNANSPCINLGNNAFAPGTNDLAGNPRIRNTVVDMGAYEFHGAADPDYDGDGWGNADEYIAATDPTNGASLFPEILLTNAPAGELALVISPTSTSRVYGVYANTNLLQSPQAWTLVPPEQTGTASALTLTITNTLPGANYRTGVRLP